MAKLTQSDLVTLVASDTKVEKEAVGLVVKTALDRIMHALADGSAVALKGFGRFMPSERKERDGRNPRTGEAVKVDAYTTVKFKTGRAMKAILNGDPVPADADADEKAE